MASKDSLPTTRKLTVEQKIQLGLQDARAQGLDGWNVLWDVKYNQKVFVSPDGARKLYGLDKAVAYAVKKGWLPADKLPPQFNKDRELTEEEVADLKEAFAMFDINGDGTIELNELQQVMRKLGQNPTEAELIEMINTVDDNGDHEIDFEEFLILMKSRIGERDPEKELKDAFAVFDTDKNGSIDRKELKRLMKKLGQALSEAELDAMMDEVDTNGDGEISFAEFKAMMES